MRRLINGLAATSILAFSSVVGAQQESVGSRVSASGSPAAFLIRDAIVQAELGLDARETQAIRALIADLDKTLWRLRDVSPDTEEGGKKWSALEAVLDLRLNKILDAAEQRRLKQIVLQAQGVPAMLQPELARKLQLSSEQQSRIQKIRDQTRKILEDLGKGAGSGIRLMRELANQLRAEASDQILEALSDSQRSQWVAMLGKPFDLAQVQWVGVTAPELPDSDAWINSTPLNLAKLRGKVVALHFWTFG